MKDIKLIIFDLDGTLINAYPAIIASFNYTMKKVGFPLRSKEVIRRTVGWGDRNLLKPFVSEEMLDTALKIYRQHHAKALLKSSHLYAYVPKVLWKLQKRKIILSVASNRPGKFSRILIRHLGIKKYFKYVLCADAIGKGKPHPEMINTIMRRFSVKPQETLFVGDMCIDAEAGRRAKVKTIIVTTGSSALSEIKKEKPYRIIDSITKLLPLVLA